MTSEFLKTGMEAGLVRQLDEALDSVESSEREALSPEVLRNIVKRKFFRPEEDEAIAAWFAAFLATRESLWSLIRRVDEEVDIHFSDIDELREWRLFLVGYVAACLLVRQDRFFLFRFATHSLIQRKLNEAIPEYDIPRKQYSKIFRRYTDPVSALRLYDAMRFSRKRRDEIRQLSSDPVVGRYASRLKEFESYLDPSTLSYFRRLLLFISHKWRRRGASASHKTQFAIFEWVGRFLSELDLGKNHKWVTDAVRAEILDTLRPGDVLVTRHRLALTTVFLPGTWPHASMFIGSEQQRESLGIELDPAIAERWSGDRCTLEALKDGVRFRRLADTLRVDQFVVLRPNLSEAGIREGIERVAKHEGKGYNFDFDFFSSDRLVCTEVIYRAFDGVEGMDLPLILRGGRQTLSAEDLLDLSLDTDQFEPVAIYGFPKGVRDIQYGDPVPAILTQTYRA